MRIICVVFEKTCRFAYIYVDHCIIVHIVKSFYIHAKTHAILMCIFEWLECTRDYLKEKHKSERG